MSAIRIRTRIESTTLCLPELAGLVGKTVEIVVEEAAGEGPPKSVVRAVAALELEDDTLAELGVFAGLA